jgi:DNA (cytosine-5)-methyltransferase 1
MSKMKFNAIDLFSGCGGFSFGFQQAGFNILLGIDNDAIALRTFEKNHTQSTGLNVDLHREESIQEIIQNLNSQKVDVIIAGPPCQGFSLTGTRNENDKRNTLFYSVFELAEKLNPSALIIENVPGIATLYKGKVKDEILRLSEKLGYKCTPQVLYAPDFGVPQIRKRMFFVCLKKELGVFEFPSPIYTEKNYITCEQAISDLPTLEHESGQEIMSYNHDPISHYQKKMRNGSNVLYNHVATMHTDLVKSVISQVPEGGNYRNLPVGVGDSRIFHEAWTRYHSKRPSRTIDTGHRNHFHYKWNRVPTVRENARLQSFPDNFIFIGNKTQQNKQVGNAVPPLLGYHVAKKILEYIVKDERKL